MNPRIAACDPQNGQRSRLIHDLLIPCRRNPSGLGMACLAGKRRESAVQILTSSSNDSTEPDFLLASIFHCFISPGFSRATSATMVGQLSRFFQCATSGNHKHRLRAITIRTRLTMAPGHFGPPSILFWWGNHVIFIVDRPIDAGHCSRDLEPEARAVFGMNA